MIKIAETDEEIRKCFPVMSELRPHFTDENEFVEQVRRQVENDKFQLVFLEDEGVRAVAGIRIGEWLAERGLPYPASDEAIVRLIVESLAEHFAGAVRTAADLSGVPVEQIHVVGGGCQNRLLCQLTADRSGLPVVAGPIEATALGNVLIQARAHGRVGSLAEIRQVIARSFEPIRYEPRR